MPYEIFVIGAGLLTCQLWIEWPHQPKKFILVSGVAMVLTGVGCLVQRFA